MMLFSYKTEHSKHCLVTVRLQRHFSTSIFCLEPVFLVALQITFTSPSPLTSNWTLSQTAAQPFPSELKYQAFICLGWFTEQFEASHPAVAWDIFLLFLSEYSHKKMAVHMLFMQWMVQ